MKLRSLYVQIDGSLHRRLKVRAAEVDQALGVVVTAALQQYLAQAQVPPDTTAGARAKS